MSLRAILQTCSYEARTKTKSLHAELLNPKGATELFSNVRGQTGIYLSSGNRGIAGVRESLQMW